MSVLTLCLIHSALFETHVWLSMCTQGLDFQVLGHKAVLLDLLSHSTKTFSHHHPDGHWQAYLRNDNADPKVFVFIPPSLSPSTDSLMYIAHRTGKSWLQSICLYRKCFARVHTDLFTVWLVRSGTFHRIIRMHLVLHWSIILCISDYSTSRC